MRLKGKVALVTGASRGIGAAIARIFAQEGAAVAAAARDGDELVRTVQAIAAAGGDAVAIPADVRCADQVQAMVARTISTFGKLDVLVNNAGVTWFGHDVDEPGDEPLAKFDDIVATNLRGAWLAIRCAVPHMKAGGGGSIIQIGSVHGRLGAAQGSAYSASKGGLDAMTRALAVELAPYNIRVNSCNPGAIDTKPHAVLAGLKRRGETERATRLRAAYELFRKHIQPLRMNGQPEDVAWACVYLASDESRYVTGSVLMVDGGLTALLAEPARFYRASWPVIAAYEALLAEAIAYLQATPQ